MKLSSSELASKTTFLIVTRRDIISRCATTTIYFGKTMFVKISYNCIVYN